MQKIRQRFLGKRANPGVLAWIHGFKVPRIDWAIKMDGSELDTET